MKPPAAKQISGQHIRWLDAETTTNQTKEHKMKTVKHNIIGTGIALAIALAAWLPTNLNEDQAAAWCIFLDGSIKYRFEPRFPRCQHQE